MSDIDLTTLEVGDILYFGGRVFGFTFFGWDPTERYALLSYNRQNSNGISYVVFDAQEMLLGSANTISRMYHPREQGGFTLLQRRYLTEIHELGLWHVNARGHLPAEVVDVRRASPGFEVPLPYEEYLSQRAVELARERGLNRGSRIRTEYRDGRQA